MESDKRNYKINIAYDGTHYHGWQIQANLPTVQGKITDALELLLKHKINLIGSGRTDTGVHAFEQPANFITDSKFNNSSLLYSLNSVLPYDISVKSIEEVPLDFSARFDAKRRTYLYFITRSKSAFFHNYSYLRTGTLNIDKLNEIAALLPGRREYDSFTKHRKEIEGNSFCDIYDAHWRETKDLIIFKIEANRFLHGMVRAVTGTQLMIERDNLPSETITEIIEKKDRKSAAFSVPAKGLFLYKVRY